MREGTAACEKEMKEKEEEEKDECARVYERRRNRGAGDTKQG